MFSLNRLIPRLTNLSHGVQCSRILAASSIRLNVTSTGADVAPDKGPSILSMNINWPDAIKNFLLKENISKPTLIQEKTLPLAMENKDIVGIARTGSGKTLAFVIPAVMKILKERESTGVHEDARRPPTCLVLAPTRELASQTASVFKGFKGLGIRSVVLVGGASRLDQMRELRYGDQDVYIATPGRLLDLLDSQVVDLSHIKYLVFDEADRMLDMGFEPQIRRICSKIPKDRQTLMWSATWPNEIQDLARDFMVDYKQVKVDSEKLKANPNIKQIIEICESPFMKIGKLLDHLEKMKAENENPRTLIFVNTKRLADNLMLQLMKNKHRAVCMHGDRSQNQRDNALRLFRNGNCDILVATDVAARGLDINDISHVINYDFPTNIEDYIHRIGRTARHEKEGSSISFFVPENAEIAPKLIQVLKETNQEVPSRLEELALERHLYKQEKRQKKPRNNYYSGGADQYRRPRDSYSGEDFIDSRRGDFNSRRGDREFSRRDFDTRRNDFDRPQRKVNIFEDI